MSRLSEALVDDQGHIKHTICHQAFIKQSASVWDANVGEKARLEVMQMCLKMESGGGGGFCELGVGG